MFNSLKDNVVVITGASSGIGRATALMLAEKDVRVVAAARRREALESLARETEQRGQQALAVPTDVTDPEAVEALAQTAIDHYGRIDAWVNNAAVSLFARFEEAPPEAYRQVIETNLFGYIHGARAAIRRFREQGDEGTLINVSSMLARGGSPYVSAYAASKFAVNGLSMSLRQELQDSDIDVSVVMPASIDTPLFQQAANYTGRAVKPMDPVYAPEKVARTIKKMIKRPKNTVYVGNAGRMMGTLNKVAPKTYDKAMARQVERDHFEDLPAADDDGNLFEPRDHWARVDGGWDGKKSFFNNGAAKVALAGVAMAVPAMAWAYFSSDDTEPVDRLRSLLPGSSSRPVKTMRRLMPG